jgi:predicted dithiol-disulfide oxidoreductase (DUF899 family)
VTEHRVVSRQQWLAERRALLAKEKELTHLRDKLNDERRALPWVKIEKNYIFDTPTGEKSLADLFAERSQMLIYHFMMGPGWLAGCKSCSFLVDHVDGALPHLEHHDVTFTAVARAPLAEIEGYKKRMGWRFPWVSSANNDFNYDFHVSFTKEELASRKIFYNFAEMAIAADCEYSELPGLSAFYKDSSGQVFHTYSGYARGGEELLGTLMLLDRAPFGRNEKQVMDFVRRHDEYDAPPWGDLHPIAKAADQR